MARLIQGGIYDDLIDNSMAAFILELIAKHGPPAKVNLKFQKVNFELRFVLYALSS